MKLLKHSVIYRDDAWYSTFPSLTRTGEGDLLCGFRRAPLEPEGHSHLHSFSRAICVRSKDDGDSWGEPTAICPQDELGQQDPQLATLADGRLIASFFRWQAHAPNENAHIGQLRTHNSKGCLWSNAGVAVCVSDDHGATWSDITRLQHPWRERGGASRGPVVELPDGRLLLPCYGTRTGDETDSAWLMRSDDRGRSWCYHALMATGAGTAVPYQCHEPYLLLTSSGELLCFIRTYVDGGRMLVTRSSDGGESWSEAVITQHWGFPQSALQLRDGRIFVARGYRREPLGVRATLFDPQLANLDSAVDLAVREDGASRDLGYPTAIQRRDGNILLAYYIHGEDGVRHIAASLIDPE